MVLGKIVAQEMQSWHCAYCMEESWNTTIKSYVCYVDYEKAFDHVEWTKLMMMLQNIEVDWRDRKLIWNLYNKQVAYVRIEDGLSTACTIGRGVRQCYSLSSLLYLIYDEAVIREATDNMETGISIGGRIINTIRYTDDKALVANSQKGLQQLMNNLNKVTMV